MEPEPRSHNAIGGRDFLRLDDTRAFLHACMHAALGSRRVRLAPPLVLTEAEAASFVAAWPEILQGAR